MFHEITLLLDDKDLEFQFQTQDPTILAIPIAPLESLRN